MPGSMAVSTPLSLPAWEWALTSHPDRAFARYICQSLRYRFRIGFQCSAWLRPAKANVESAKQYPEVVSEYLHKEFSLGCMLGPFPETSQLLHISRFGVIPKGHNTGRFRLITDLSCPPGSSVNDGIDPDSCSLAYTTVDEVAAQAAGVGRGAL